MSEYCENLRFEREDLIPMLPAQDGACDVCFQGTEETRCDSCARGMNFTALRQSPAILPMALRVKGTGLWRATWQYKNADSEHERDEWARSLAWFAWHFMSRHEGCLARRVGVNGFDFVVPVPSSGKREGTHPLVHVLREIPWFQGRVVEDLFYTGTSGQSHRINHQRFDVRTGSRLAGRTVLLVDDTITSGSNIFSALDALAPTRAKVGVAVIGRHFDPDWTRATRTYYDTAQALPFDFGVCALCDRRPASRIQPSSHRGNESKARATDPWDAAEMPFEPPF